MDFDLFHNAYILFIPNIPRIVDKNKHFDSVVESILISPVRFYHLILLMMSLVLDISSTALILHYYLLNSYLHEPILNYFDWFGYVIGIYSISLFVFYSSQYYVWNVFINSF